MKEFEILFNKEKNFKEEHSGCLSIVDRKQRDKRYVVVMHCFDCKDTRVFIQHGPRTKKSRLKINAV